MIRTIVAMGGGSFSSDPANLLMERFCLQRAKDNFKSEKNIKALFIPTASADNEFYEKSFFECFKDQLCCESTSLALYRPPEGDLKELILSQHIIFVGGGNTKNMLALWQEWDIVSAIRAAYERGVVLCGVSAGAICWFEKGHTDSFSKKELKELDCLGFLKGSLSPHFHGEKLRVPSYQKLVLENKFLAPFYAVDDGAALLFEDEKFMSTLSSRPGANGFELNKKAEINNLAKTDLEFNDYGLILLNSAAEEKYPQFINSIQEKKCYLLKSKNKDLCLASWVQVKKKNLIELTITGLNIANLDELQMNMILTTVHRKAFNLKVKYLDIIFQDIQIPIDKFNDYQLLSDTRWSRK